MPESHDLDQAVLEGAILVPAHVVHRDFVEETVILNLETGQYHGLNPSGGRMLEVLERSKSVRAAATELAEIYAQPLDLIERDLVAFCGDLIARGLIEACETRD